MTAGYDAAQESVSDWTPHDVAEWLYLQGTKDDHAHTFLVHNIDGPALLGLSREKLLEWRVKAVDANTILKGVQDLRRIEGGQVGWQLQDSFVPDQPKPPKAAKPSKAAPRKKPAPAPVAATPATLHADTNEFGFITGVDDLASAPVPASPPPAADDQGGATHRQKPKPPAPVEVAAAASSQTKMGASSPTYLRKVMGDLHTSERVPLWKEEMVERVKRTAQTRKIKDMPQLSQSAPVSARTSMERTPRNQRATAEDTMSSTVSDAQPGAGKRLARDAERKVFWYQDAIHEQELQKQLLEQKVNVLQAQVQEILDHRRLHPELPGVGAIHMEKEMRRRQQREMARLSKNLQVSEERVADAERVNSNLMELINKLRRGRADFLHQLAKLTDREAAMSTDMKHFAQVAHQSLDEKEKTEARLKRQQFDYKVEGHHFENVLDNLQVELQALDEKINNAHHAEEELMQQQRQSNFRNLKAKRDTDQKRELKLGYLQNHVRGQEMDFQRLHRIMGVKFTPEKPESVMEIVSTSLKHEQRNASLLHYVGVQTGQVEVLQEELRKLEAEELALESRAAQRAEAHETEQAHGSRDEKLGNKMEEVIELYEGTLQKLCPIVLALCDVTACKTDDPEDGLAYKGCRPDTLSDYLRLIDVAIKELHARASVLPTASGNEWLRDFLEPKAVNEHPNVFELRKELEIAAQKQKEQKAYATETKEGAPDTVMAGDAVCSGGAITVPTAA